MNIHTPINVLVTALDIFVTFLEKKKHDGKDTSFFKIVFEVVYVECF